MGHNTHETKKHIDVKRERSEQREKSSAHEKEKHSIYDKHVVHEKVVKQHARPISAKPAPIVTKDKKKPMQPPP